MLGVCFPKGEHQHAHVIFAFLTPLPSLYVLSFIFTLQSRTPAQSHFLPSTPGVSRFQVTPAIPAGEGTFPNTPETPQRGLGVWVVREEKVVIEEGEAWVPESECRSPATKTPSPGTAVLSPRLENWDEGSPKAWGSPVGLW